MKAPVAALEARPGKVAGLLRHGKIRIAVLGLGRIGLPTAAVFAASGAKVVGVDVSADVVRKTNAGRCKFVDEPGLPSMVKKVVMDGNLRATAEPDEAISNADFILVCVPTPVDETKTPDYSAVRSASHTIGRFLRKGSAVVIESTIGPGIAEEMVRPILEEESGLRAEVDFGLASCPERSDPGNILLNMKSLPRIIGGLSRKTTDLVVSLYEAALGVRAIRVGDPKTANAVKLTENLFRDVNIALANEFALLYEKIGIDAIEVINACASKYNFMPHYPGAGVGGPCLMGDEYVFLVDSQGPHSAKIGEYVNQLLERKAARVEEWGPARKVRPNDNVLALSFDGVRSLFKKVPWFSIRPYSGRAVRFRLTTNRYLSVTLDHPMVVKTALGIGTQRADDVKVGDEFPLAPAYSPPYFSEPSLDVIEALRMSGSFPLSGIKVKPEASRLRDSLEELGPAFRALKIPRSKRHDYYRWNYLPLDIFLELEKSMGIHLQRETLSLYPARGDSSHIPAVLDLDEDFWRLIGYYASEGCLYEEEGLRGTRERIKITFGAHEGPLIEDCRSILVDWGMRVTDEVANGSHSLKFSSRILGHLLREVLKVGTGSHDKKIPPQLFFSSRRNIAAFLQGLFRGDGWVERSEGVSGSVSLGFATVSTTLFQGVLLLLQVFGITPTCRRIISEKSKVPAQALRIARYEDLQTVQADIGGIPKLGGALESYYRTTKKSAALADYRKFKTAFVRSKEEFDFQGDVYNMEVEETHTFVSSYGIVTHNCLPSNSYYLISEGVRAGNIPYLIRMAREINDRMPDHVVELVGEALNDVGKTIRGSRVAILGVAYKPDIKDIQLTPIERIATRLQEMGARVEMYDPMFKGEEVFGLKVKDSLSDAVRLSDCIVIGTAHSEFKTLDLAALARLMHKEAALVDTRSLVSPAEVARVGLAYRGVGRKHS